MELGILPESGQGKQDTFLLVEAGGPNLLPNRGDLVSGVTNFQLK